jgi:hypothetical protein
MSQTELFSLYRSRVKSFLEQAYAHLITKSPDYEDNELPVRTFRLCRDLSIEPWKGCLLRLGDKLSLLYTFVRDGKYSAHDESFQETMLDIVVYASLTAVLYDMDSELDGISIEVLLNKIQEVCTANEKSKTNLDL